MEDLVKKLATQLDISEEKARKAIAIMGDFLGEKYPTLKGQISNMLGSHGKNDAPQVGGINLEGLG